jgi:hypothetical protein
MEASRAGAPSREERDGKRLIATREPSEVSDAAHRLRQKKSKSASDWFGSPTQAKDVLVGL